MALPKKLKQKYLKRLEDLIERGSAIKITKGSRSVTSGGFINYGHEPTSRQVPTVTVDYKAFRPWQASCVTLLTQLLPKTEAHAKWIKTANSSESAPSNLIPWLVSRLQSVKEDLDLGFLDDLGEKIEGEIASDYMTQAESLLGECRATDHSYIPAAVLAGAVLERHLREMCTRQDPPIEILKNNGKPKTLDPLISDLARAGAITSPKASLLRGFAAIRNKAAHGEWDEFDRDDVENMVNGVKNFLAFN